MKSSPKPVFWLLLVGSFLWGDVRLVHGQNDPKIAVQTTQAELERERIEIEKKSIELQKRELALEKARQEFEAQQSGRSLSMNLSGDLLFDYDKATLKPEAEQALRRSRSCCRSFPKAR